MHPQPAAHRLPVSLLAFAAASLLGGCAHLAISAVGAPSGDLPDRAEVVAGQLVIHADFPIAGQHRLVRDLEKIGRAHV